ncbi:MAG TPA: hypothetical protein VHA13_00235, partial [Gammaproteobacteria bacterium]|nr:hypothetical protein [Gammaproteobacteria bacterium]
AISIFLAEDKNIKSPKAKFDIVSKLHAASGKYFEHRDKILRYLADILLTLSVVGLIVLAGRKLMNHTFFFSSAATARQEEFEKAVSMVPAKA